MKRFWKKVMRPDLPYTIAKREFLGQKRYRLSLVASPRDFELFRAMMLDATDVTRGKTCDVAYVFVFATPDDVGANLAIARGLWVRNGAKGPVLMPGPKGVETEQLDSGVFTMAVL